MTLDTPDAVLPDTSSADLRSDVYALLASLLVRPPPAERLVQLANLTVLPGIPALLGKAVLGLKDAAGHSAAQSAGREYADLLIGLGLGQVVPYASW